MTVEWTITLGNMLTIAVAILVPSVAFIVSLVVLRTTVALEKKRTDEKLEEVNKRVDHLQAEMAGLKTGFEAGIGRVQESLATLGNVLNEVKTKVVVLFDRDERQAPASRARRTKTIMSSVPQWASDWDLAVRRRPSPIEIARLVESHGLDAAKERWPHVGHRTLYIDLEKGKALLAQSPGGK